MKLLDKDGLTYYTSKIKNELTDYVKNTDYATNVKGGVLKTGNGTYLDGNGIIVPSEYSMSSYNDRGRNTFISKGTLENVITGKGLVSNTDYASASVGGVIKATIGNQLQVNSSGELTSRTVAYSSYGNILPDAFISKGTLDNAITGKGLITNTVNNLTNYYDKTYIDNTIGNIESILETLDIGSGV